MTLLVEVFYFEGFFSILLFNHFKLQNVTAERDSKLKEAMKMMGLSSGLHWIGWFTRSILMMEISICCITLMLCTPMINSVPLFGYSNPLVIWIFFNVYAVSVITFCFLLSTILRTSSSAGNTGSFIFLATYLPVNFLGELSTFNYVGKVLYCSLLNAGMDEAIDMILHSEAYKVGVTFGNLFKRDFLVGFSVGEIIVTMVVGAFLQMLLTLYIEKAFPGKIGSKEPWYFPLIPCINRFKKRVDEPVQMNLEDRNSSIDDFEIEPNNLNCGIEIKSLRKEFKGNVAVSNLNLRVYEGQLTVLLGHNVSICYLNN